MDSCVPARDAQLITHAAHSALARSLSGQGIIWLGGRSRTELLLLAQSLAGEVTGRLGVHGSQGARWATSSRDVAEALEAGLLVVSVEGDFAMRLVGDELEVQGLAPWLRHGYHGGLGPRLP